MLGPIKHFRERLCPHERIADCPLYVASHVPHGMGCVGNAIGECDVTAGKMKYDTAVRRLTRGDA